MEKELIFNGESVEIELLLFKVGGFSYGVDINDIKEILPYNKKATPIPNAHPFIEGIIMPRDFLIPIISLEKSLKLEASDEAKNEMLIVTSIKDQNIAFHVDSVLGIQRIMTTDIIKPGKKVSTSLRDVIIGIYKNDTLKAEILEFRKIINEINPTMVLA
ncbi:purine-binding chemotaxis protein CheW [Lachnospiraceae bacterium MD1]|uniref:Purine-binding chemotaxis protein CheW n=1 Tax=Variimorphobacter saccharofermentans TaxID=2755051 RepID=A0A839K2U2_9FIRM|nr:chemotaxis protein CheW [Variimorphobacter saccharofermentans]MBB2183698.1 purine-binding chemotaxis protein CheW [Variimorphobacter saccharofermentans]